MRIAFTIAALLLAAQAIGQTITGAAVDTNGWQLKLWLSGINTNGTYDFGFGTNNQALGSEKLRLTLTSQGFTEACIPTTLGRLLYGTKRVRYPYPGHSNAYEFTEGPGIRITVSLSSYVFSGDSNLTATIASGLYAQGGTNSSATASLTVTNNSTQTYPMAIGNWTWPCWNRETGSTMRLRAVGFGGQIPWSSEGNIPGGRPLAGMQMFAADLYGNTSMVAVSRMTIDRTLPDLLPAGEYVGDLSIASMSNASPIRCDFALYPHIGDVNSVFDTRANTYTGPSPLPKAITNFCDRLNVYSTAIAAVDPTFGSDLLGAATNGTSSSTILTNHYFATIAKALQATSTNNAATGSPVHTDMGGAQVFLSSNVVTWLGGSQSYGTSPPVWVTLKPLPGHFVNITNQSGNQDAGDRIKLQGITLGGAGNYFAGTDYLWFDACVISNANASHLIASGPNVWITHSRVPKLTGGLRPFSTQSTRYQIRGADLTGFDGDICASTLIGTVKPAISSASNTRLVSDVSSGSASSPQFTIWYNNYLSGLQNSAEVVYVGPNIALTNGVAIVQNVFEITTNLTATIFGLGGSALSHTNIIFWYNDFVGKRVAGFGYNDTGTAAVWRIFWSRFANVFDNAGMKTDTFTTANSNRVGNWAHMWGVNGRGSAHLNVNNTGVESPASFVPEFWEMNGYHPLLVFTNTMAWSRFIDRRSPGGSSVTGGGNYRLYSDSPLQTQVRGGRGDYLIPFDLDGKPRGIWDPPGAYTAGNPRQGSITFFAQ
jgi:hypothetical protein